MSNGKGRVVELSAAMRPTAALNALRLDQIQAPIFLPDERSHVAGGELSIQVLMAPPEARLPPGKWLAMVIERWPSGHIEVLSAFHADTDGEAFQAISPLYRQLIATRKV